MSRALIDQEIASLSLIGYQRFKPGGRSHSIFVNFRRKRFPEITFAELAQHMSRQLLFRKLPIMPVDAAG
jgi:hypothetical protein